MRPLSISVLGGTGFVGSHLASGLIRLGHHVQVLSRNRERHRALLVLPGLELVNANVHDPSVLAEAFRGSDAVINLIGILNEGRGATFARVHAELARKLIGACRSAGVAHLIQLSALGAAAEAPSRYLRSKAAAERCLREDAAGVETTILRPSVIVGPGDGLTSKLAGLLGVFPLLPLARGDARLAPVVVSDVIEAIVRSLDAPQARGATLELCGPDVFSLVSLARYVAEVRGLKRRVFALPEPFGWLQAALLGLVPGKPMTLDNYRSLGSNGLCGDDGFARLGITPTSLRSVVPGYLGAEQQAARFSAYRRAAGARIDEP